MSPIKERGEDGGAGGSRGVVPDGAEEGLLDGDADHPQSGGGRGVPGRPQGDLQHGPGQPQDRQDAHRQEVVRTIRARRIRYVSSRHKKARPRFRELQEKDRQQYSRNLGQVFLGFSANCS